MNPIPGINQHTVNLPRANGDELLGEQHTLTQKQKDQKQTHTPIPGGNASQSGSAFPLVSGANGSTARPIRNTRHIVTPAYRIGSASPA